MMVFERLDMTPHESMDSPVGWVLLSFVAGILLPFLAGWI
jgi:hypothetical protein